MSPTNWLCFNLYKLILRSSKSFSAWSKFSYSLCSLYDLFSFLSSILLLLALVLYQFREPLSFFKTSLICWYYLLIYIILSNCYCGNSYGLYGIAIADSSCSIRCSGSWSYMCGGGSSSSGSSLLNSIYATSLGN